MKIKKNRLIKQKVKVTRRIKEYSREYMIRDYCRRYYGPDPQILLYEKEFETNSKSHN